MDDFEEFDALVGLLVDKGVFKKKEFENRVEKAQVQTEEDEELEWKNERHQYLKEKEEQAFLVTNGGEYVLDLKGKCWNWGYAGNMRYHYFFGNKSKEKVFAFV